MSFRPFRRLKNRPYLFHWPKSSNPWLPSQIQSRVKLQDETGNAASCADLQNSSTHSLDISFVVMDVGGRTNEMSWRCSLAATNETTRWIASNDCGSAHFIFTFILSAVCSRSELLAAHAAAPCPSCSKNYLQNCKTWDSSWIQKQTMNQIGFEVTLIYGNQTLQYLGSFGLAKAKDPFSGGVSKNRDEEWCFFLSWKTPRWNSRENPMAVRYLWPRCQIQRSGYIQFLLEDVGTPRNQSDRIGVLDNQ